MKKIILSLISFLFILSSCSFDIGKKNEGSISFSGEQIRTIINNARNQFEDFSSDEDGYLKLEVQGDFLVSKKLFFSEVAENDIESYNSFLTIENIPVGSRVTVSLSLATKGDYVLLSGKSSEIIIQQGENSVEIILKRNESRYPIESTDDYILIIGQDNSAIVEINSSVTTYERLEEILNDEILLNKLKDKEFVTLDLSQTSISVISCSTRNEIIDGVSTPVKYSIFAPFDIVNLPTSLSVIGEYTFIDCDKLTIITIPNSLNTIKAYAFIGCLNLNSVLFEDTDTDWEYTYEQQTFIISDLTNPETNATNLITDYVDKEWNKSVTPLVPDWQTMQDVTSYNVGDLVLSNGKVFVYSNERTSYTFENGVVPVAVIFKAGNKNEALGLGLTQQENIQWVNSSFTEGNTTEYDYTICSYEGRTIADSSYYGNDSRVYESNTDGSENWQKIYDNFPKVYPQLTNYPVFNFADEYGNADLLSSTDYKEGWYIPSTFELYTVYKNIDIVNSVLSMIETYGSVLKTDTGDSNYWTSSQYFNGIYYVDVIDFSSGLIDGLGKTSRCNVCVIRKF